MFKNIYQNKKILVTGHTGFKGSWLVKWFEMLGSEIYGISLAPNIQPNHFSLVQSDVVSHILDIREAEKLSKTMGAINPDIIFHLAAQPLVRESYQYPLETLQTNIMGTANLLNACRYLDNLKAIVIITTDKCYENKEWIWGYREDDSMGGYDPYSMSKGCVELVISSFRRSYFNLDEFGQKHQTLLASARGGNVMGGGDWSKDRLIPDVIKAAMRDEKVNIRSPYSTRPWQHVLECLSGYLALGQKLLQGEKVFAGPWNFGPAIDVEATVLDVLTRMQKQWSKIQYQIEKNNNNPHEAHLLKLDCSKANFILKWKNLWNIEKTIAETTEWYQSYYEKNKVITENQIDEYVKEARRNKVEWVE